MKVLELFCGTKSIANAFQKRGHEIYTVDWNAERSNEKSKFYARLEQISLYNNLLSIRRYANETDGHLDKPPVARF